MLLYTSFFASSALPLSLQSLETIYSVQFIEQCLFSHEWNPDICAIIYSAHRTYFCAVLLPSRTAYVWGCMDGGLSPPARWAACEAKRKWMQNVNAFWKVGHHSHDTQSSKCELSVQFVITFSHETCLSFSDSSLQRGEATFSHSGFCLSNWISGFFMFGIG